MTESSTWRLLAMSVAIVQECLTRPSAMRKLAKHSSILVWLRAEFTRKLTRFLQFSLIWRISSQAFLLFVVLSRLWLHRATNFNKICHDFIFIKRTSAEWSNFESSELNLLVTTINDACYGRDFCTGIFISDTKHKCWNSVWKFNGNWIWSEIGFEPWKARRRTWRWVRWWLHGKAQQRASVWRQAWKMGESPSRCLRERLRNGLLRLLNHLFHYQLLWCIGSDWKFVGLVILPLTDLLMTFISTLQLITVVWAIRIRVLLKAWYWCL